MNGVLFTLAEFAWLHTASQVGSLQVFTERPEVSNTGDGLNQTQRQVLHFGTDGPEFRECVRRERDRTLGLERALGLDTPADPFRRVVRRVEEVAPVRLASAPKRRA